MLNSISKIIIKSAIIITPFLATSQVHAEDENVYDVSQCITISGSTNYNSTGAIVNVNTVQYLRVRCPIQRDRNHRTLDPVDSFVFIRDLNRSKSVSCFLRQNIEGNRFTPLILETTSLRTGDEFSSTEYQRYSFSAFNFSNRDEGSFYMDCTLPPVQRGNLPSSISSYHIDED